MKSFKFPCCVNPHMKVLRRLFLAVVFLLVPYFAFLSFSSAAEKEKTEVSLSPEVFQVNFPGKSASEKDNFDQESVQKIQESLKVIGYDAGEISGLIDKKTSAALRKFREDFEVVSDDLFSDHLIATLFHYADVAKVHPDWKDITLSKSFTDWINKQPTKDQVRISKLRRSGSSQQIITLLNEYKSDQAQGKGAGKPEKTKEKKSDLKKKPTEKEPTEEKPAEKNADKKQPALNASEKAAPPKTEILEPALSPASVLPVLSETSAPKTETKKEVPSKKSGETKSKAEVLPKVVSMTPSPKAAEASLKEKIAELQVFHQSLQNETIEKKDSESAPMSQDAGTNEVSSSEEKSDPAPNNEAKGQEAPLSSEAAPFKSILEQAKNLKAFDASKSVVWEGEDCGCLVNLSGKTIYGFYPFWLAGEPQTINFSLLSRIGYYALSFDEKGEMSPLLHWHHRSADFVTEAQRYRTKLDLVIYKNDWHEGFHFSKKDQWFVIDKITTNIVRAVHQKMPDTLESRVKSLVASKQSMTLGDGVTLYFEEYPEDEAAITFFKSFVKELRQKLQAKNKNYKLNLMLPMHALGHGIYAYENLEKLMGEKENPKDDLIDLFLVLLKKPTTKRKKALRLSFEKTDEFKGAARKNILRKIVPVISPLGHEPDQYRQFEDDLIYFEDNFGGVGFWPLPFASDKGAEIVEKAVKEVFTQKTRLDFIDRMFPSDAPSLCKWICPRRWFVRLAYDALGIFLVFYGFFALFSVSLRNIFLKYKFYFGVAALVEIIVIYAARMCDPYLSDTKDEMTAALLFVSVLLGFVWNNMRMKEKQYP